MLAMERKNYTFFMKVHCWHKLSSFSLQNSLIFPYYGRALLTRGLLLICKLLLYSYLKKFHYF